MPGVLLTILKIIGIILAVLVGLTILALCLILFVPVHYETAARFAGSFKSLQFKISFYWFFKQVRIDLIQRNGVFHWQIKIFWFKRRGPRESAEAVEEEVVEEAEIVGENIEKGVSEVVETEAEEVIKDIEEEPGSAPESVEETFEEIESAAAGKVEREEHKIEETEAELEQTREQVDEGSASQPGENGGTESASGPDREEYRQNRRTRTRRRSAGEAVRQAVSGILGAIQRFCKGVAGIFKGFGNISKGFNHFFEGIKCTFKSIYDRIKVVSTARETFLWFIHEDAHGNAWKLVRKELSYLGRKIKPKKAQLRIRYGFNDPYYTGRILCYLAFLYPFMANVLEVIPDYEKRILRSRLYLKGGLRLYCALIVAVRLMSNEDVRITYNNIRKTLSN